jgi:prevent-host-death family protein
MDDRTLRETVEGTMRKINVAEDIVSIGHFKTHASELLDKLHATRRPLVITQNGKPAAVVLTPEEFDDLGYHQHVREKVAAGLASAEHGAVAASEARRRVKAKIAAVGHED